MKNVVVLRNLPSNLIEEAFVVVKSKKIAKSLERIDARNEKIDGKNKDDGYIVRELSRTPSNFRCEDTIQNFLKRFDIPGIAGIDTRALTRILKERKERKERKKVDLGLKRRYNMLKIYGVLVTVAFVVAVIL